MGETFFSFDLIRHHVDADFGVKDFEWQTFNLCEVWQLLQIFCISNHRARNSLTLLEHVGKVVSCQRRHSVLVLSRD